MSITGGVHFDLVKRVLRDIERSGQQPAEIIQQVRSAMHLLQHSWPSVRLLQSTSSSCRLTCTSCLHAIRAMLLLSPWAAASKVPAVTDIQTAACSSLLLLLQISDTVYPMYKAFIEPDLKTAHLRIYNTFNPFAGFM